MIIPNICKMKHIQNHQPLMLMVKGSLIHIEKGLLNVPIVHISWLSFGLSDLEQVLVQVMSGNSKTKHLPAHEKTWSTDSLR